MNSRSAQWAEKRAAKEELVKPRYREFNVSSVADVVLADLGLSTRMGNRSYVELTDERRRQLLRTPTPQPSSAPPPAAAAVPSPPERSNPEPLAFVRELRQQWERHLATAVCRCSEGSGLPLMRLRPEHDDFGEPMRRPQLNLRAPPVYELDELFDLLAATPHPNHTSGDTLVHGWSVVKLQLATPSHAELRERFAELAPHERQCGLDDDLRGWFADERQHIGQRALASRSVPVVLQLAKTGIPLGMRGQAWLAALQLAPLEREYMHLARLQRDVARVALGIDAAVRKDATFPIHEEPYFIFAEAVEEVLLAFCRDPTVQRRTRGVAGLPRVAGLSRAGAPHAYPPCGFVPGRGFSMFVFPLCYLYQSAHELYYVHRELWCRYWCATVLRPPTSRRASFTVACPLPTRSHTVARPLPCRCRLHAISSQPSTLLPLLALVEAQLQQLSPHLSAHLHQLGTPAARLAAPWVAFAFASYLPPEQTLLLWDRVIGFDSLELLPALATAVFLFHEAALLQAADYEDVHHVLLDATELKVVPLLQAFLFDVQRLREG